MANSHQAKLGQSGEDYLEAILAIESPGRPARVKDLAGRMGVSRPSVVAALAALSNRGLVRHERYGGIELTEAGRRTASEVSRRHAVLRRFLSEVLGVSARTADTDACRIEHALSPETVNRMTYYLGRHAGPGRRAKRP
jgi:DtxR family Mn-dependent transcriptional regulator